MTALISDEEYIRKLREIPAYWRAVVSWRGVILAVLLAIGMILLGVCGAPANVVKTLAVVLFVVALLSILLGWTAAVPLMRRGQELIPGQDFDTTAKRSGLGIRAILRDIPPPRFRKDSDGW